MQTGLDLHTTYVDMPAIFSNLYDANKCYESVVWYFLHWLYFLYQRQANRPALNDSVQVFNQHAFQNEWTLNVKERVKMK